MLGEPRIILGSLSFSYNSIIIKEHSLAYMDLNHIHALILDMDGVIWRGSEPIGNPTDILNRLSQAGFRFVFATNNATRTVDQYITKLSQFGVQVEPWQIVTSATATAAYLSELYPDGGTLFVIGEHGLIAALEEKHFSTGIEEPIAVVVGLDKGVTYQKLEAATLLIRQGLPFIVTNPDRTFPTPRGQVPGAGAILAALEAATDSRATIIGKPQPIMFQQALENLSISARQTLVVGDRLETDIAGGQAAGCHTALVLSGVSTEEMSRAWSPPPDLVLPDLASLVEYLT